MKSVEASVVSRSQSVSTGVSNTQRLKLVSGQYSWTDRIFPVFDEMLKYGKTPAVLEIFQGIFMLVQLCGVSFWPAFAFLELTDVVDDQIKKWFLRIAFFSAIEHDVPSLTISLIILTVLLGIILIFLIIQIISYFTTRKFSRPLIIGLKIVLDIIPVLTFLPCAFFVGICLKYAIMEKNSTLIVFTVVGVIYLCCFGLIHYINAQFGANSPYISTSPMACWSGSFHFQFIAFPAVILICSFLVNFFHDYFEIIIICIKLLYNIYMFYHLYFMPFAHMYMNEIFSSMILASTASDIYEIVSIAWKRSRSYIDFIVLIVSFIVSMCILKPLTQYRVKKIAKNMSLKALEQEELLEQEEQQDQEHKNNALQPISSMQDEKKTNLYMRLGLGSSQQLCMLYFRVGLSHMCPLFLDWSLVKFAGDNHRNAQMFSTITQFLSFFPCETRLLSYFFTTAISSVDLNFAQRFLIYQVNVIKGLRQSSASTEVADKITRLKSKATSIIQDVRRFWVEVPEDENVFYQIYKNTKNISELYLEAMDRWPNNVRICENYSNFLIEGATDFKQGIFMKHRAELIEQGKNFVIDLSFRSLIKAYPMYLKNNIMDVHGKFIKQEAGKKGSTSSSGMGNSQMSTGTIDGILDPEIEESLAKSCFTYHRLRLEFQTCLENRKLKHYLALRVTLFVILAITVAINIFYIAFYYNHYDERLGALSRQIDVNMLKYSIDVSILIHTYKWLHEANYIQEDMWQQLNVDTPTKQFDIGKGSDEIVRFIDLGLGNMSAFSSDIMTLAQSGRDVYSIMGPMLKDETNMYFCVNNQPLENTEGSTLKEVYVKLSKAMSELCLESSAANFGTNDLQCEILSNLPNEEKSFINLATSVLNTLNDYEQSDTKINTILMIVIPILYVIIAETPLLTFLALNLKELKYLHKILTELNQDIKDAAAKSVSGDDTEEIVKETSYSHKIGTKQLYIFALLPVLTCIFMIIAPYICEDKNTVFGNLNTWIFLSTSRAYYAIQGITYASLSIAHAHGLTAGGSDLETAVARTQFYITRLSENNNNLLRGGNGVSSSVSYSDELDALNIRELCIEDNFQSTSHNDYRCCSTDSGVINLLAYLRLISNDPSQYDFTNDSPIAEAFHITSTHLLQRIISSADVIYNLANDEISSFRTTMIALCIGCIVFAILVTWILWVVFNRVDFAYSGVLQELRRVPPLSISSNQTLMNYITHKSDTKKIESMTPAKSVIYTSSDSVVFLGKSITIEFINESVTMLFGYTPDQLLGQHINNLLPEDKNPEFYTQLEIMKNGQCALTYEKSFQGLSDDEQTIPVHTTLVGIPAKGSNLPNSFVVIMRDETNLINQRKSAESAKQQSEKLLYQILPRDIVTRLNRGETDITMTVPMATVIFIDIVKFSNYSATLSPNQIMEHLSLIFAKFDAACARYPLITKIKLIGDVYMAAAGLFTPDEPDQNHASQTVNFALDALQCIEEVNTQLNANLQVRIGINTNGPLIAGVLGTDKPVFDIIGDPINVASRLQSTAVPNTIQISEETFKLISGMNYNIEKRGEIELKGKGKKVAYVVRPAGISSFYQVQSEVDENLPA